MFTATSITEIQQRLARGRKLAIIVGVTALALAGTGFAAAAAMRPKGQELVQPPPPVSVADHLSRLEQLHAQVEEAKLQAELNKYKTEAKDGGAGCGPPLPTLPNANANLGGIYNLMPPLPGEDPRSGGRGAAAAPPATTGVQIMEAWGSGANRQAIVRSGSSNRLVHIGDEYSGGSITAISPNSMTIRTPQGRSVVLD